MSGPLAAEETRKLAETFRLLGDPTRLSILLCCLKAPRPVSDIAAALGRSQSLISHHLRLLRAARLMRGERRARQIFYSLDDPHIREMLGHMVHHLAEDDILVTIP